LKSGFSGAWDAQPARISSASALTDVRENAVELI